MTPLAVKVSIDWMAKRLEHGCGNHGCVIRPPIGQGTNAVCDCQPKNFAKLLLGLAIECEQMGQRWDKEKP